MFRSNVFWGSFLTSLLIQVFALAALYWAKYTWVLGAMGMLVYALPLDMFFGLGWTFNATPVEWITFLVPLCLVYALIPSVVIYGLYRLAALFK